ncbi:hypothetical protein CO154_01065 [Candidatus Pacearchaeota archaeon CG_4_9_14_3_um_filter_31_7]|nr:MAG: hypothetical protein CO154_01065 [Candidatus Pacearchaeota archaeon CG_4_9_14_3_um_filter_31_7]
MMPEIRPRGDVMYEHLQTTAANFLRSLEAEGIKSFERIIEISDFFTPQNPMETWKFDRGMLQMFHQRELNYHDIYYSVPKLGMPVLVRIFPEESRFEIILALSETEKFPLNGYRVKDYNKETRNYYYLKEFNGLDFELMKAEIGLLK